MSLRAKQSNLNLNPLIYCKNTPTIIYQIPTIIAIDNFPVPLHHFRSLLSFLLSQESILNPYYQPAYIHLLQSTPKVAIIENKRNSNAAPLLQFYNEYASSDFCEALRILFDYDTTGMQGGLEPGIDTARRKVKFYYLAISRLRAHNLIDRETCLTIIEQRGYEILRKKIKPLEKHIGSEIGRITVLENDSGQDGNGRDI